MRGPRAAEMRGLFGCLAVLLGAVSVSLAARYGYKGADTTVDGLISAVVFGAIALCAFIFDAAAVRLWFMRHHLGSLVIGTISGAALVVTFTNSLGAIAGRADISQAERVRAATEIAADRAELARLARERDAIILRPVTEEALTAARDAAAAAERIRLAECGNGDPRQVDPTAGRERQRNRPGETLWVLFSSTKQPQPGPQRSTQQRPLSASDLPKPRPSRMQIPSDRLSNFFWERVPRS